ncbi:hypothetical protein PG991_006313 [Apiospora marii]|uniref:Uncharacterized protein n=2 Tax=Apiospora marii TaxID=335849 RepID=A0ABR1SBN6_9PEZI
MTMGNSSWTISHWGLMSPARQSGRRPFFGVEHIFQYKQKRGRPVGKREMAEKHYRRAAGTVFVLGGNPRVGNILNITPQRPYPKLPSHRDHHHRDWKGQRNWLREEMAYGPEDLTYDAATGGATYSVSKAPKREATWY